MGSTQITYTVCVGTPSWFDRKMRIHCVDTESLFILREAFKWRRKKTTIKWSVFSETWNKTIKCSPQLCHIWHIWHIWHTWHLAYDIYKYVNMGLKRSVRASGIQPTILNILQNYFYGQKLKYPDSSYFLCIFKNFLCIFHGAWAKWICSLRQNQRYFLTPIYHRTQKRLQA